MDLPFRQGFVVHDEGADDPRSGDGLFRGASAASSHDSQTAAGITPQLLEQQLHSCCESMRRTSRKALSQCFRRTMWQEAIMVLEIMRSSQMQLPLDDYALALGTFANSNRWAEALHLIEEMRQVGTRPNVVSYNAAIFACSKHGRWRQACHLLSQLRRDKLVPDEATYLSVIRSCSHRKPPQWAVVLQILEEMSACGKLGNSEQYDIYIISSMQATQDSEASMRFASFLQDVRSRRDAHARLTMDRDVNRNRKGFVTDTSDCGLMTISMLEDSRNKHAHSIQGTDTALENSSKHFTVASATSTEGNLNAQPMSSGYPSSTSNSGSYWL
eukprot:TRINITY_DN44852_c0_g1_i1.p1 TRINITY_DN44852_c0_g1~~TRINITY_DN44852_c0_g1_i1.p1  ORF type:complete len:329 (+),score=25.79 TRINITY_DN44852_c0_g1_i1:70-1056(+)